MPYRCLHCGKVVDNILTGSVRCPGCGFKVFVKVRDPVTKNVKAV